MGASFHAAWIGALYLSSLGTAAAAVEAIDLLYYDKATRKAGPLMPGVSPSAHRRSLIYISQSGNSGEVAPLLAILEGKVELVAVTNQVESPLARQAQHVLPMCAGEETLIASKTYLNAIAAVWMLARAWVGMADSAALDELLHLADVVQEALDRSQAEAARLLEELDANRPLLFLGHGPHAATARQAAMTLSEWAKRSAFDHGIGAFRHGFIESVTPGIGVLIFNPPESAPGKSHASALRLAEELHNLGARVLLSENGRLRSLSEKPAPAGQIDEFLSPALDIVLIQAYAEALRQQSDIPPAFRHISKVVTRL
jgi:glucosamine--fructose-6-phosphate aminotransferase (isomerizing)